MDFATLFSTMKIVYSSTSNLQQNQPSTFVVSEYELGYARLKTEHQHQ